MDTEQLGTNTEIMEMLMPSFKILYMTKLY